jgi:hypothetical protein
MRRLQSYFFDNIDDRNGKVLPFSRFDVFLAVVLGVTMLAALAYSDEPVHGWTAKRAVIDTAIAAVCLGIAQHRRVVVGCAFGVVTLRFLVGIVIGPHSVPIFVATAGFGALTWVFLRDID